MDIDALKAVLGIDGTERDGEVNFAVDTAEEYIKNYCRIGKIPDRLKNTAINMAADILRAGGYGSDENTSSVKKIDEGDISVTFDNGGTGYGNIFKGYNALLDTARKAGW